MPSLALKILQKDLPFPRPYSNAKKRSFFCFYQNCNLKLFKLLEKHLLLLSFYFGVLMQTVSPGAGIQSALFCIFAAFANDTGSNTLSVWICVYMCVS